jgi:hypothetical protein
MNPEHTPLAATGASRLTGLAGRAVEGVCWALAVVLVAVYCGARSYGELERRDALALFIRSLSSDRAAAVATRDADRAQSGPIATDDRPVAASPASSAVATQ